MKNITQYFEDTVKSNNSITIDSDEDERDKLECKKDSKEKRNRVKIKISRTNTKERVCDIIESSSDMIDKTPSPFAKENNVDKNLHETPKRSSLSKLSLPTKQKKLVNQRLNYLALETNNINVKKGKQSIEDNFGSCLNSSKTNINNDVSINGKLKNKKVIDNIEIITIDSEDKTESNREESNAFQILMSRSKPVQCASPTKPLSQNEEVNTKMSEEYKEKLKNSKEKLKHSKEKLIALADKKGYSKRKLAEVEEGEKIERMIQSRIKLFKREEKKDNSMDTVALNHKQPTGPLLNYFSKTAVDLAHTNMKNITTVVVKADVHMTENTVKRDSHRSSLSDRIQPNRKHKGSDLKLSEMDDIVIIESENINTSNNKRKQKGEQRHNKHRWSLRIKLQSDENENASLGESSDEELFSVKSKIKVNMENCKKSKSSNSMDSENLLIKDKNKRGVLKQTNEHTKLKLKKREQPNLEHNDILQDNKCLKERPESKHKLTKFDDESILTKDKNLNSNNDTNLEVVIEDEQSHNDCIIIDNNNSKRKSIDKLAPLFTKRKKPDPKVIAARKLFLQPDMTDTTDTTDNFNKNKNRKVNIYSVLPFPLISHITQLSSSTWNETNFFNIPKEICNEYIPIINVSNFKHLLNFTEKKLKTLEKVNKPNVQDVLTDIEKHCSHVKEMWNVISLIIKEQPSKTLSPKTRIKRSKQSQKKERTEHKNKEDQFQYCSWTYKYRPKSSQEVVGNEDAVAKLKEWLLGWKTTVTDDVSSGDEFYSSGSSRSKISENNQVAVLLGPHGCGKTASVYAVAEEFGYTVLELNASSRRTGKKLLKELEEATKSHRIKKDEKTSVFSNSISDEVVPKKIPQNSLILLEDVDIIFEEDEGFISATYQLASNSKRPIVMTCRDVCLHLNKMAPQQKKIHFQNAVGSKVSALLELISLAETGYRLPFNYITEVLQSGDLRKAILQLQYLLLSGPPQILEQTINFKNSFWQNMRCHVYKPIIKTSKKWKRKKATNNEIINHNNSILIDVANKLDNIALVSSLIDVEDSALDLWEVKTLPNLSLVENTASYSASSNISLEIAEWMGSKIMYNDQLNNYDEVQYQNNIVLKQQLIKGVDTALSHTTSLLLDRHIIATDYIPSVRAICRAEELKANTNNKRGNRFFHYLHNLKAPSVFFKPSILTAACKMMYDTVDNDMRTSKNNTSLV